MSEQGKQTYRVGLTGGIASGKSTVADMFAELGVAIIDTDLIAREVVQPGEPALEEICERFGDSLIDAEGKLDRAAMRSLVFANDGARHDLEAILHPRIEAEVMRQADTAVGPYQLIVVPLMLDSPLRKFVDRLVVVDCDEETQLQRLLLRDAESPQQARRIISTQSNRQERLAIADDVVHNDQRIAQTQAQVIELDRRLRRLAKL